VDASGDVDGAVTAAAETAAAVGEVEIAVVGAADMDAEVASVPERPSSPPRPLFQVTFSNAFGCGTITEPLPSNDTSRVRLPPSNLSLPFASDLY
jgi:hypothetical protein